jgi:hypothetical protein
MSRAHEQALEHAPTEPTETNAQTNAPACVVGACMHTHTAHTPPYRQYYTRARLAHSRTHAQTHKRDAQCAGAGVTTAAGRGNTLAMRRVAARAARRSREEDKPTATHNSPPHTFKSLRVHGSRALQAIRAALGHEHAQPLHSRRPRPQTERAARRDEQHYGECILIRGGRSSCATIGGAGARSHCCLYCPRDMGLTLTCM